MVPPSSRNSWYNATHENQQQEERGRVQRRREHVARVIRVYVVQVDIHPVRWGSAVRDVGEDAAEQGHHGEDGGDTAERHEVNAAEVSGRSFGRRCIGSFAGRHAAGPRMAVPGASRTGLIPVAHLTVPAVKRGVVLVDSRISASALFSPYAIMVLNVRSGRWSSGSVVVRGSHRAVPGD
jgi:hypothetical protein